MFSNAAWRLRDYARRGAYHDAGLAQLGISKRQAGISKYHAVPGYTRTAGYFGRYNRSTHGVQERKFRDGTLTDATLAASVVEDSLNHVPQGDGESNRVGRRIFIEKLALRYELEFNQAQQINPPEAEMVRVIVYLDKQTNGAAAVDTDVLKSSDCLSFNNLANRGRFKILYDKITYLGPGGGAGNGTTNNWASTGCYRSYYKKWKKPLAVDFDGATGGIAEIKANNIGLLILSEVTEQVGIRAHWRIRYTD